MKRETREANDGVISESSNTVHLSLIDEPLEDQVRQVFHRLENKTWSKSICGKLLKQRPRKKPDESLYGG